MGRILVLYQSNSGNTAAMARLVVEGARSDDNDVRIRDTDEATVEDLRWCHGVALGSPTNYGTVSWKMKKWWDDLPAEAWQTMNGKIGCAFSSSGAYGGGTELTCMTMLTILMNYGFLVFGVTEYVADRWTLHYGATVALEPRSDFEKDSCTALGRNLSHWVNRYFSD